MLASANILQYLAIHLSFDLFKLKNGTRVTHDLGNDHTNFVFFCTFLLLS